jgi:hypothetical protein
VQPDLTTWSPFLYHELAGRQGVLLPDVRIDTRPGVETSHGQGTLYLLTGRFDEYQDVSQQVLGERFESKVPTLFEYLRRTYDLPEHQTLIVNGEDRVSEEFYTFSNHHNYGVAYKSTVLSLYRFKTYLLRKRLAQPSLSRRQQQEWQRQLDEMQSHDDRLADHHGSSPELDAFWDAWRGYYGDTGLTCPRGDRLLTELALWAMKRLRPRLMMVNYNDPDYVHWGPASFYTRAITVIDDGIRQLWEATRLDPAYRDNTVFVVVPDCGRDDNRCAAVPFQHHFNSSSSRRIFAVVAGPGIAHPARPVDHVKMQTSITATIGQIMGFATPHAEEKPIAEVFA